MEMIKRTYKSVLMGGILLFLYVPLIQSTFHVKNYVRELNGAYSKANDSSITVKGWFDGSYQQNKDVFLNQNFGFRNYYVRVYNQLDYSLFNKANVEKVVIGKGGFLYESNYITSYFGENFAGEEKLRDNVSKLKAVQDLLYTKGILLEVVFAPGKATFYPEFLPDNWKQEKKLNNYEFTRAISKKEGLDFMDVNDWFLKIKNYTPYDLYPKTGIHWSNFGSLLFFDSLTKKIESDSKLNLRNFEINTISISDSLISPDNDIAASMNLIWDIPPLPMPYAQYSWSEDSTFTKPKALFIGDSYFWNIYYQGLTNNVFDSCKFWYYNQTVYPENEPQREVSKLNLLNEISKQQVIVIMATDCNIHDIGWGFIDQLHKAFFNEMTNITRKKAYLTSIMEDIYGTPQWMEDIKVKAKSKNISIPEMVKLDADYIYETEYNKPEVVAITEDVKKRIQNTPEWLEQIKKKAKEKNITFEEMVELDAKYIYITEYRDKSKK